MKSFSIYPCLLLVVLTTMVSGCKKNETRPNFIILYTDDHRYNTIHALGNEEIKTPNIDRLVDEGVAFTRAHIMGGRNGALCVPSRAMLHTGRTVNKLFKNGSVIPIENTTLPEALASHGYKTFMTGKWHNDKESLARIYQDGDNIYLGGMHWPKDGGHFSPLLNHFDSTGVFPKDSIYHPEIFSSTAYTNAALEFIKNTNEEDPFFLYVAFTSPHDPRTPPKSYAYDTSKISLPVNFLSEHPFDNGELKVRDEQLLPVPRLKSAVKQELANYYGMISEVDNQIGRILEELKKRGIEDNTYIILAGDNGLAVGSHGLLGKQNLYDHSVRVPMIFKGPDIPKNKQNISFAFIPDIYPTIMDLAHLPIPEGVDGKSLVGALKRDENIRETAYYLYRDLQRGVRTSDNWKIIKYLVKGKVTTQLFDLNKDPWEMNNLADSSENKEQLIRLEKILQEQMEIYGDDLDPKQPYFGKEIPIIRAYKTPNIAVGKKLTYQSTYSEKHTGENGDSSLIDGLLGLEDDIHLNWQGFEGSDISVLIDLEKTKRIDSIHISFLENQGNWIFLPKEITIETSVDGNHFDLKYNEPTILKQGQSPRVAEYAVSIDTLAKYVRVKAKNRGQLPKWHAGAGGKAWLFIDEIWISGE